MRCEGVTYKSRNSTRGAQALLTAVLMPPLSAAPLPPPFIADVGIHTYMIGSVLLASKEGREKHMSMKCKTMHARKKVLIL